MLLLINVIPVLIPIDLYCRFPAKYISRSNTIRVLIVSYASFSKLIIKLVKTSKNTYLKLEAIVNTAITRKKMT